MPEDEVLPQPDGTTLREVVPNSSRPVSRTDMVVMGAILAGMMGVQVLVAPQWSGSS